MCSEFNCPWIVEPDQQVDRLDFLDHHRWKPLAEKKNSSFVSSVGPSAVRAGGQQDTIQHFEDRMETEISSFNCNFWELSKLFVGNSNSFFLRNRIGLQLGLGVRLQQVHLQYTSFFLPSF